MQPPSKVTITASAISARSASVSHLTALPLPSRAAATDDSRGRYVSGRLWPGRDVEPGRKGSTPVVAGGVGDQPLFDSMLTEQVLRGPPDWPEPTLPWVTRCSRAVRAGSRPAHRLVVGAVGGLGADAFWYVRRRRSGRLHRSGRARSARGVNHVDVIEPGQAGCQHGWRRRCLGPRPSRCCWRRPGSRARARASMTLRRTRCVVRMSGTRTTGRPSLSSSHGVGNCLRESSAVAAPARVRPAPSRPCQLMAPEQVLSSRGRGDLSKEGSAEVGGATSARSRGRG